MDIHVVYIFFACVFFNYTFKECGLEGDSRVEFYFQNQCISFHESVFSCTYSYIVAFRLRPSSNGMVLKGSRDPCILSLFITFFISVILLEQRKSVLIG